MSKDPGFDEFEYSDDDAPVTGVRDSVTDLDTPALRTSAPEREPPYVLETATQIAEPIPPLKWLCHGLRLARGSVRIIGGYGYSRKTLFCQSLALSIASGKPALGVYEVDHQPVLHIDYEQGRRITRERYQRMARSMDIELTGTQLSVVTFPRVKLTDLAARDILRRMLEESQAKYVIVDSLRASVSGIDENSSEIRECIDLLGQEVKRIDAAADIIHHACKPQVPSGGGPARGGRYSLRGSGAIFDAVDGAFVFSGEKGKPTDVSHEKDRLIGTELPSFGITSEDVAGGPDSDPRWGLRVAHLEAEQVARSAERERANAAAASGAATITKVTDFLRALPQATWLGNRSDLAARVGGRKTDTMAVLSELVSTHRVEELTRGKQTLNLRWVGP